MLERRTYFIVALVCVVLVACGNEHVRNTEAVDGAAPTIQRDATVTEKDRVTATAERATTVLTATSEVLDTPISTPSLTPVVEAPTPPVIADCASDADVESFARAFVDAFNADTVDRFAQFLPSGEQNLARFEIGDVTATSRGELLDVWARRHAKAEQWTVQDAAAGPRLHRNSAGGPDVAIVLVQFIRQAEDLTAHTVIGRGSVNCIEATIEDWWSNPHESGSVVEHSIIERQADSAPGDPPPTVTDERRDELFDPGPAWKGQGAQGISQAEAERFRPYPIFWLGESYAGYNLQVILANTYTPQGDVPAHEAMDSVGLIYGDCTTPEGSTGCPPPIQVSTEPICLTPPGRFAGNVNFETVRGEAQLLRFGDSHVRLWTGKVSIRLDPPVDPSLVDQLIEDLSGLNTTLQPGAPLPPPDLSQCKGR